MTKTIRLNDLDLTLSANVWTLLEYKRIFKRDWQADRNAQIGDSIKALNFYQDCAGLTDEQFAKLPKVKQEAYWQGLKENKVDTEFLLNTIFAMAISGGYKNTQQDLFSQVSAKELAPDSELMQTVAELISEFLPEVKKNK